MPLYKITWRVSATKPLYMPSSKICLGMRILYLLASILLFAAPVSAAETVMESGVTEEVAIEYDLHTLTDGSILLTYTFGNTKDTPVFLNYSFEFFLKRANIRVLEVSDTPAGSLWYNTFEREGEKLLTFHFERLFSPRESYRIDIRLAGEGLTERIDGRYRFRDIEGNLKEWPIRRLEISVRLPREGLHTYEILKVDPGAGILEEGGRKRVVWGREFIMPGEEFSVLAEYASRPNLPALAAALLVSVTLAAAWVGYFRYGRRRLTVPREFIKNVPGDSTFIARLEEMLRGAQEEVLITSPWIFYVDWITGTIKPLVDRGIKVRIVTWPSYERVKFGTRAEVTENKKQVFALRRFLTMFPPETIRMNDNVHAKMVVADRKELLVSSVNLTQTGLWENYEAGVWMRDEALAGKAAEYFEELWEAPSTIPLTWDTLDPGKASRLVDERKQRGRLP